MRIVQVYSPATRAHARTLRQQGLTYTEICHQMGRIPQGTLAGWLKNIHLTAVHRRRIHAKIIASAAKGRPLARAAWANKMARWREQIETRVKPLGVLPSLHPAIGKLVCGIMYLCEGGKYPSSRQLIFGNSDPAIIRTFLALVRQCYPVDERKWRIRVMHRCDQDGEALRSYWSEISGVPLSQCYRSYADQRTRGKPTGRVNTGGYASCITVTQVSSTSFKPLVRRC